MSEEIKKEQIAASIPKEKKITTPIVEVETKNYVYIGPNRFTDGLKGYTVYRGYPTDLVDAAKGKYTDIARLFVPVDKLDAAMAEVTRMGTPLYLAFHEVERGE